MSNSNKKELTFVILSGFCVGIGGLCAYMSLNYIPLMDATVLFNLQPLVVLIVSSIWLKEKAGCLDVTIVFLVLLGVVGVCQPAFLFGEGKNTENSWIGYIFGVCASIPTGLAACLIRRVATINTAPILITQGIIVIPICYVWAAVIGGTGDPTGLEEWLCFLVGVMVSSLARINITASLKYEPSYIIALVQTTEILFSMVFQIVLFQVFPNWAGVLGAMGVMSGVIMITLKNQILTAAQKFRKKTDKSLSKTKNDEKCRLLH